MSDDECIYFFFSNNRIKKRILYKTPFISKLISSVSFIQNEIHATNKLKALKEYKKYYYLYDIIEKSQGLCDTSILTKYENKGLVNFDTYLSSLSCSRLYIYTLIESYRHLLSAIVLLIDNKIIHNNINFETIQTNKSNILLTNFSHSIDITRTNITRTDLNECMNKLCMNETIKPIEIYLLSYLQTNKLDSISNNNINCILDDLIEQYKILRHFGAQIIQQFRDDGATFLQKYINKSIQFIYDDILTYYATWDNYALSVSYLVVLIDIHKNIKHSNKFVITFMRHLLENISFNPIKRCTVETTTNKFDKMIYEIEPSSYALLINEL